jgi:hypothetical protein
MDLLPKIRIGHRPFQASNRVLDALVKVATVPHGDRDVGGVLVHGGIRACMNAIAHGDDPSVVDTTIRELRLARLS